MIDRTENSILGYDQISSDSKDDCIENSMLGAYISYHFLGCVHQLVFYKLINTIYFLKSGTSIRVKDCCRFNSD
ncbi:hypothetical protein Hanom_Chr17g01556431 [Helianthus anomalus]